jgi:hypothetical protein
VAPNPTAVRTLEGVVQYAAPERLRGATRVVSDRAFHHLLEAGKTFWSVEKVDDDPCSTGIGGGGDVDEYEVADEVGPISGDEQADEPTERHTDEDNRTRQESIERFDDVPRVFDYTRGSGGGGVRVSVVGEVDGEGGLPEGEEDRVERVGVLAPSVEENDSGGLLKPLNRRDVAKTVDGHEESPARGEGTGELPLTTIFLEYLELVVHPPHRRTVGSG